MLQGLLPMTNLSSKALQVAKAPLTQMRFTGHTLARFKKRRFSKIVNSCAFIGTWAHFQLHARGGELLTCGRISVVRAFTSNLLIANSCNFGVESIVFRAQSCSDPRGRGAGETEGGRKTSKVKKRINEDRVIHSQRLRSESPWRAIR